MYDIRVKTSEPTSTSTSLTEIDESHLISELATVDPTSSVPSSNDARNSPVFHRQSQLLDHGKQHEKMQGRSFTDVVAMLRQQTEERPFRKRHAYTCSRGSTIAIDTP
jgi:hypothetical protein